MHVQLEAGTVMLLDNKKRKNRLLLGFDGFWLVGG